MISRPSYRPNDAGTRGLTRLCRSGLSLMEVMFAIGVLLIGIVGLAHVLPIGMNQSADAIASDKALIAMENLVSQTMLQAELATREGFVIPDRWIPSPPAAATNVPQDNYLPYHASAADYRYGVCVDPWFLTAGFNKRNQTDKAISDPMFNENTLSGYDRGLFPCYDRGYNPLVSPSQPLYNSAGGPVTAAGTFIESLWNAPQISVPLGTKPRQPRFLRVAPAALPSTRFSSIAPRHATERATAAQSAEPSLIAPEKDKSLPAGRRYQPGVAPVRGVTVGRYSAMSFVVSHEDDPDTLRVSTAVLKNRIPTTNPGAVGAARFPLVPYTYNSGTAPYYEGEQMMYVHQSLAPATMGGFAAGLGGQVELVMHRAAGQSLPRFRRGQYLMFMRHVYPIRTAFAGTFSSAAGAPPIRLDFDWFRIADVVGDPATNTESTAVAAMAPDPFGTGYPNRPVWRITLDLRGPSWLFDDGSRVNSGSYAYSPATYQDATYAVWMPDVVGVHERTLSLRGR